GPGYEGFGTNLKEMKRIGTMIGCEASKVILGLSTTEVDRQFAGVIESGAPLGIWKTVRQAKHLLAMHVVSRSIQLPLQEQLPIEEARAIAYSCRDRLLMLQAEGASDSLIKEATFKAKRSFFALERSELYCNKKYIDVNVHFIRIGDI